ncbi:hypothetical protein [Kitasatospora sp. NPDC057015]|uniref:hypothetical protein n=1 Tax=Kitasatospora sp. NPDC057015 TaxID=3346001 RepID=UPI00362A0FB0
MKKTIDALEGWTADDAEGAAHLRWLWLMADCYETVGFHQHSYGTEQFFVAADLLAPSAMTGSARAAAVHLRLDPATQSCHVRMISAVTFAWAGHWLVQRGTDPRALADYRPPPPDPYHLGPQESVEGLLDGGDYWITRPGDTPTRLIEDRVRRSGDRYQLLGRQMAYSGGSTDHAREANWALLLDRDPRAVGRRFLLQLETVDIRRATYTLAEGGFRTMRQALDWIDGINPLDVAPLPAVNPATGLHPGPRKSLVRAAAPTVFQPPHPSLSRHRGQ